MLRLVLVIEVCYESCVALTPLIFSVCLFHLLASHFRELACWGERKGFFEPGPTPAWVTSWTRQVMVTITNSQFKGNFRWPKLG